MGIKEMLAAKKAAAAPKQELATSDPQANQQAIADYEAEKVADQAKEETISEPVKPAPASVSVGKPLSFAEKMALKKAQESASATSTPAIAKPVEQKPTTDVGIPGQDKKDTEEKKVPSTAVSTAKVDSASSTQKDSTVVAVVDTATGQVTSIQTKNLDPASVDSNPELSQAYQDIHQRIQELSDLSDEPLEGAMKELKKALMANPSAVSLMLDEDIGKMVIALRKMTGVAMAEATKPKEKKAPKAKNVMLTAEQLATAFDEL